MSGSEFWVERLGLAAHPEGGFFRETYRSDEEIPQGSLDGRYDGPRNLSTAIYYLLPGGMISAFHILTSDESWYFHEGSSLTIHMIDFHGAYRKTVLGKNPLAGEVFHAHIKRGTWFGASVDDRNSFSLMSCTVSPGFHFGDFRLGDRGELLVKFPAHKEIIELLTH